MSKTVSGHDAIKNWGDPRLASRQIPGTRISLRTRRSALPLFLNLFARLNREARELSPRDTWSFNYRPIRLGQATSDHAGYACDAWSSTVGQMRWPSKMPAKLAREIGRILEDYRTPDGRYIFLWGASRQAPGVDYKGPTHQSQKGNDPMHFAIARGITNQDLMRTRKAMGLKSDGTIR